MYYFLFSEKAYFVYNLLPYLFVLKNVPEEYMPAKFENFRILILLPEMLVR